MAEPIDTLGSLGIVVLAAGFIVICYMAGHQEAKQEYDDVHAEATHCPNAVRRTNGQ